MKNQLLIFLSLVSLSSMAIASDNTLKSKKQVVLVFAQNGMDQNLFHDILQSLTEIGANQVQLVCNEKPLSRNSDIRLLMKNINLILELEKIIDDNHEAIAESTKSNVLDFTTTLKSNYKDMIKNSK